MAKEKEDSEGMWREHHRRRGNIRFLLGLFLLVIGLGWLGSDLGWWNFDIPWAPLVLILFAISLIVGWGWRYRQD
jgi:uncharacterized membrane protein